MIVAELIEHMRQFDQSAPVFMASDSEGIEPCAPFGEASREEVLTITSTDGWGSIVASDPLGSPDTNAVVLWRRRT